MVTPRAQRFADEFYDADWALMERYLAKAVLLFAEGGRGDYQVQGELSLISLIQTHKYHRSPCSTHCRHSTEQPNRGRNGDVYCS